MGWEIKLILKQSGNSFVCSFYNDPAINSNTYILFNDPETNLDLWTRMTDIAQSVNLPFLRIQNKPQAVTHFTLQAVHCSDCTERSETINYIEHDRFGAYQLRHGNF